MALLWEQYMHEKHTKYKVFNLFDRKGGQRASSDERNLVFHQTSKTCGRKSMPQIPLYILGLTPIYERRAISSIIPTARDETKDQKCLAKYQIRVHFLRKQKCTRICTSIMIFELPLFFLNYFLISFLIWGHYILVSGTWNNEWPSQIRRCGVWASALCGEIA